MTNLEFALSMEASIKDELERQIKHPQIPELKPMLALLIQCQISTLHVLSQANSHSSAVDICDQILGDDINWRVTTILIGDIAEHSSYLVHLWIISTLLDKSEQYYRQAALNSAYQQEKLFFNSIAEIKLMQKRRIDSMLRSAYNIVWADVGFAPFSLGKS